MYGMNIDLLFIVFTMKQQQQKHIEKGNKSYSTFVNQNLQHIQKCSRHETLLALNLYFSFLSIVVNICI